MRTFTLPQLCEEMGLGQKMARAMLRKAGMQRPGTRWVFMTAEKASIRALLKGKPVAALEKRVSREREEVEDAVAGAFH